MLKRSIPVIACLILVWTTACSGPDAEQSPTVGTRDPSTAPSLKPVGAPAVGASATAITGQIGVSAPATAILWLADPTSTPKPTATARPTRTPRPRPTPTVEQAPFEYQCADQGVLMAFEALGYSTNLDNEMVREFYEDAFLIRGLFHLATSDVGEYRLSYDGYLEWVMNYIEIWLTSTTEDNRIARLSRHVDKQVYFALTEPLSEIGITLRGLETAAETISLGSSTTMYWNLLIGPSTLLKPGINNNVIESQFGRLAPRYIRSHLSNPSNEPDFSAYLVNEGFASHFEPRAAVSQSAPTPTQRVQSTISELPRLGNTLYESRLSEWSGGEYAVGHTETASNSLHINVYRDGSEHIVEEWTGRYDFADISASVELREISKRANSAGCISIRHDVSTGDYSFCIMGDGRSWAAYHYVDSSGVWHVETLLWPEIRNGTTSASSWNTIEIVAKGNQLWFLANDTILGGVTHNARIVGAVAISVTNWDEEQDAEFEFRNLVVRAVR